MANKGFKIDRYKKKDNHLSDKPIPKSNLKIIKINEKINLKEFFK